MMRTTETYRLGGLAGLVCLALMLGGLGCARGLGAEETPGLGFRIATYNVENLFDLETQTTEYPEYLPGGASGWDDSMAEIKYRHIARVLIDLNADIVALQEVESDGALMRLQHELKSGGLNYPHRAFSKALRQTVGCALLSRFPIRGREDIPVDGGKKRSILKVEIAVRDRLLTLYVNHWKSKKGPESARILSATALAVDIAALKTGTEYVILGDLNANYNEYQTFLNDSKRNDTRGRTGINHVLKTVKGSELVTSKDVIRPGCEGCLYNLWLECPLRSRWSHNFFGSKGSLDHILVPFTLFDGQGIDYQKDSFKRFKPDYLFRGKALDRWRISKRGRGRHLGGGFSDHLPVYADFTAR